MTDREKLIEILSVPIYPRIGADPAEVVADFLMDNDVRPVKHAHWEIKRFPTYNGWQDLKTVCSHCQTSNRMCETPYCPHCGAKMDEVITDAE